MKYGQWLPFFKNVYEGVHFGCAKCSRKQYSEICNTLKHKSNDKVTSVHQHHTMKVYSCRHSRPKQ